MTQDSRNLASQDPELSRSWKEAASSPTSMNWPRCPESITKVLDRHQEECGLGTFNLRSVEMVGPRAGEQLRQQAAAGDL